jgi:hypothetical protein
MHFSFVTEFSPASLPAHAVRIFAGIFNEPDEPLFNIVPLYGWEASSFHILKEVSCGKLDGAAILAVHCGYGPSDGGQVVSRYAPNLSESANQPVANDSTVLLATAASQNFRYFSAVRYPVSACALLMSTHNFARLSTTQQDAIRQAGKSVEHQLAATAFYQEHIIFENLHDLGVHVDSRPSAELSAAFASSPLILA